MTKLFLERLLILLFLFLGTRVAASPQRPDYIVYKKDTVPIYDLLLEKYMKQLRPGAEDILASIEEPLISTNCMRGYQAIYQVTNDSLFVVAIITCNSIDNIDTQASKRNLNTVFGNKVKDGKVLVDWWDGAISFPVKTENNEVVSWDGVFEYVFRHETLLHIKQGKIIATTPIENYIDDPNGINRQKGDQVNKVIVEKIRLYKWRKLGKFDCSYCYTIRINKVGVVDQVKLKSHKIKMLNKQEIKEYQHCLRSLSKALKGLQFDIIKRKGVLVEEEVVIELFFEEDGNIRSNVD